MDIITGEMDGEKIVRSETSFDRMEKEIAEKMICTQEKLYQQEKELHDKVLDEEHDCHASPEDGCDCGDRVGEINGVDPDEERDNLEDR